MTFGPQQNDYFHLARPGLEVGHIIAPGNWGRILRELGWKHDLIYRELALEQVRLEKCPVFPSRFESAFVFLTELEARAFRPVAHGFKNHALYRVSLVDPAAVSFVTDHRLCGGAGPLRPDWAEAYWNADVTVLERPHIIAREMITLSALRIESQLS